MTKLGSATVACAVLARGCDPPQAPVDPWAPAARALLSSVEADGYTEWSASTIEGASPHGRFSVIYTNPRLDAAVAGPRIVHWPAGATIVAEGRDAEDGAAVSLQIMQRDEGGWLWAQYDEDDEPILLGTDAACTHCHAAGDDYVRSLALPK